jgi:hypothetical protein
MLPAYNEVKHELSSSLGRLETLRKQLISSRPAQGWTLFIILILNVAAYVFAPSFQFISFVILIIMLIVFGLLYKRTTAKFRAEYKNSIVAPLTQKIVELCSQPNETANYEYHCDYRPTDRIDDELIYNSKLFNYDIHEIHGEDLFTGRLGLTDFSLSEIKLIQEQNDSNSKSKVTMFKGVCFVADFHKDFNGLTVLAGNMSSKNSRFGKLFTRLERKLLHTKSDIATTVIKLENEPFNDAFHIRTSDEVEARYLLSSSMMERLCEFKNRGKGPISISFVDSCMFVSVWSQKNLYEANIRKEVSDKLLEELYQDISFYFGLIEDFDLNTRIWSKE